MEAPVRHRPPIELEPVAVEAPGEGRVVLEPAGVREVDEPQSLLAKRRVGPPEALVAPEVGEAGVDAHAGPGGDEEGRRVRDRLGRALDRSGGLQHGPASPGSFRRLTSRTRAVCGARGPQQVRAIVAFAVRGARLFGPGQL